MEAQAAPSDIDGTLVELDRRLNDHLTKCGREREQLGLLLVILPEETCYYGMEVIAVSDFTLILFIF
jgi:hypothetical protein